jgi:hypothetical protein
MGWEGRRKVRGVKKIMDIQGTDKKKSRSDKGNVNEMRT